MKKNLRIVSAAAAALLAVAPVAASAVSVNADTTSETQVIPGATVETGTDTTPSFVGNVLNLGSNLTAKNTDKVSDLTTQAKVKAALKLPASVTIAGYGKDISLTSAANDGNKITSLTAGQTVYLNASITLNGLTNHRNETIKINGQNVSVNKDGVTQSFVVSIPVTVFDANDTTKPYFNNSDSGVQIPENGTVDQTIEIKKNDNIDSIWDSLKGTVTTSSNTSYTTDKKDVQDQLTQQGVSFDKNVDPATVAAVPANKALKIKLSIRNNNSGLTTSVTVNANTQDASYKAYPIIFFDASGKRNFDSSSAIKQGDKSWNDAPTIIIPQSKDGQFKPTDYFKASIGGDNDAWTNDFNVDSNNVDVTKAGLYHVTISAKNNNGLSTSLTVPVVVTDAAGKIATIKNTKGYPVTVYQILNGTVVKSSNNYDNLYDGKPVKTFQTKTIDGKSYTRIQEVDGTFANDDNAWVASDKLSDYVAPEADGSQRLYNKKYTKVYNEKGEVQNDNKVIGWALGSGHNLSEKTRTINGNKYYKVLDGMYKGMYVRVENFSSSKNAAKKTVRVRSRVYKSNGKLAKKHGKSIYVKKGAVVTIHGSKGRFYNIGGGKYLLKQNF